MKEKTMELEALKNRQFSRAPVAATIALVLGLALGAQFGACADAPGRHTGLVHAYNDLRAARGWLTGSANQKVTGSEKEATIHIGKAMYEIGQAAIYDQKSLNDAASIDATGSQPGPLHKALSLALSARSQLAHTEDNKKAQRWRNAAVTNVDAAITLLRQAITSVKNDGPMPHK